MGSYDKMQQSQPNNKINDNLFCSLTFIHHYPHYLQVDLYLRNASFDMYNVDADECIRPYMIQPVNLSNLLLVVVNIGCGDTASSILSITPEEVAYGNNTLVCQKAIMNLKRKRPQSCIRTHLRESEIKDQCGLATNIRSNLCLLVLTLLLTCALAERRVVLL